MGIVGIVPLVVVGAFCKRWWQALAWGAAIGCALPLVFGLAMAVGGVQGIRWERVGFSVIASALWAWAGFGVGRLVRRWRSAA